MAHIEVPPGVPGIRSLFMTRRDTARPLLELSQILLRGPSPLTPGERELIAAFVSAGNRCRFCTTAHTQTAALLMDGGAPLVRDVCADFEAADLPPKMKALLAIAEKVRADARSVTPADIERARRAGAGDADIHDTVLITGLFCLFNRYVDGLGAWTPEESGPYEEIAGRLAREGYLTVPGVNRPGPETDGG